MKPGRLDIALYRGDTYDLTVKFRRKSDDTAIDLTGRVFNAQIRREYDAPGYITIEVDNVGAATGVLLLHLDADLTARIQLSGVWDLQETDDDRITTLLRGAATVMKDVTRL